MRKKLLLLLAAFAGIASVNAQNPKHELLLMGAGGIGSIKYDVLGGDNPFKFGYQAGLNYNFFFAPKWGIGTGVELGFYNNKVTLPDGMHYVSRINEQNYDRGYFNYINASEGFEEKQTTTMLNIPLVLQFNTPAGAKTRLYALAGMKVGIPVKSTYKASADRMTTSGFVSFTDGGGYYMQDNPEAGFDTKQNWSNKGDLDLKTSYSVTAEVGAKFNLSHKLWLYVGAYGDFGLNDIKKTTANAPLVAYNGSGIANNNFTSGNSILANPDYSGDTRLIAAGLKVRIGFGFGGKKKVAPVVIPPAPPVVRQPQPTPPPVVREEPRRPEPPRQELTKAEQDLLNTVITFYEINNTQISAESERTLDQVADLMKRKQWLDIMITGHTCNLGSEAVNMKVGAERAQSAFDYLVSKGIDPNRMQMESKAYFEPLVPNDSIENRRINRRAQMKEIKK